MKRPLGRGTYAGMFDHKQHESKMQNHAPKVKGNDLHLNLVLISGD